MLREPQPVQQDLLLTVDDRIGDDSDTATQEGRWSVSNTRCSFFCRCFFFVDCCCYVLLLWHTSCANQACSSTTTKPKTGSSFWFSTNNDACMDLCKHRLNPHSTRRRALTETCCSHCELQQDVVCLPMDTRRRERCHLSLLPHETTVS